LIFGFLGFLGSRLPLCSPLAMSLSLAFFDTPIECKCLVPVRLDQQRECAPFATQ
jgi:hypothetical protein